MEMIKKISVKTVCGLPRKLLGNLPKVLLMEIMGEMTDIETGKSTFKNEEGEHDDWTALLGQFKAKNISTRQEFFSGKCFLPAVVSDLLVAQFKIGRAQGMQTMQFAFQIGVKDAPEVAVGYEYYGQSLLQADNDPFAAITSRIANQAQLPPPPAAPDATKDHLWQGEIKPGSMEDFEQQEINP